jgi:peptidoglycan/LPS O-acetylase OafA/YrhL
MNNNEKTKSWRVDIQALRGLAVLLVVADHARVPYFDGGFLGVDIFFVISGFLMTGLIVDGIDRGEFTLSGFYARRVRRLMPAAYATILFTAALSAILLDPFELRGAAATIIGAFTFTTNIVLWKQVDYFDVSATLKPLLHMWSLAVEEQYYILIPIILMLCPRKMRMGFAVTVSAISFAACILLVPRAPAAAFYLLPTRAWELGIGSIAALVVRRWGVLRSGGPMLRGLCAAALIAIPIVGGRAPHPGWVAASVCLITAWLVISDGPRSRPGLLLPLTWVGDRSYSLYLVHWPILAVANNVSIAPVSEWATVGLLVLIALLTELQYRFVEQRFRAMKVQRRSIALLTVVPMAAIAVFVGWSGLTGAFAPSNRDGNPGFSAACESKGPYVPSAACEDRAHPGTLVWGDSFAMHLVPGLSSTTPDGVGQATRFVCGPFLDIAPTDNTHWQRPWSEDCIRFNRSVYEYLSHHPEIHTVVLSSMLRQYLPGADAVKWRILSASRDGYRVSDADPAILEQSLEETVRLLHGIGKRVVFVEPPPSAEIATGRCLSRADAGRYTISDYPNCAIPVDVYHAERQPVLDFIRKVDAAGIVPVLSFEPALCNASECDPRVSGVPLYSETGHFSVAGSRQLALEMNWGRWVGDAAR